MRHTFAREEKCIQRPHFQKLGYLAKTMHLGIESRTRLIVDQKETPISRVYYKEPSVLREEQDG
jgi:hypothetical protein